MKRIRSIKECKAGEYIAWAYMKYNKLARKYEPNFTALDHIDEIGKHGGMKLTVVYSLDDEEIYSANQFESNEGMDLIVSENIAYRIYGKDMNKDIEKVKKEIEYQKAFEDDINYKEV